MAGDKRLGVGILGAAAIARKNVKAIAQTHNGVEVVAVGSRTLEKAQAFVRETGLEGKATAYGSYEEVLDSAEVDAVYVPLPTAIHLKWVRAAAAKGKHILLEKPIALTNEDTDGIAAACREAGVQFMDGTMFPHHPRYSRHIRRLLDGGALGPFRGITSTFYFAATDHFLANDVRTRKDGDALGCYGDLGWYCIRAALWAFNYEKPVLAQAHPGARINENGVVLHGAATLLWADGRKLTFDCGFDTVHSMYMQFAGRDGMVELMDFCIPYQPLECAFTRKGPATWHDNDVWIEQRVEQVKVPTDRPQETFMWEAFAELVYGIRAGGQPDYRWLEQSALCSKLTIAVDESAHSGCRPIDLTGRL